MNDYIIINSHCYLVFFVQHRVAGTCAGNASHGIRLMPDSSARSIQALEKKNIFCVLAMLIKLKYRVYEKPSGIHVIWTSSIIFPVDYQNITVIIYSSYPTAIHAPAQPLPPHMLAPGRHRTANACAPPELVQSPEQFPEAGANCWLVFFWVPCVGAMQLISAQLYVNI